MKDIDYTDAVLGPSLTNGDHHTSVEVPVLIIGGGPSGLLQSYLLSQLGIQSLVVERYPERLRAPKAHALSPRSLEICRQFGLDVRAIRQLGTKRKDAFWVNFLTTLTGESIGILPYERMDAEVLDSTPEMIHNIPQPAFEQFVSEYLLRAENADIRKGVSFVSLTQTTDGVTTVVEERATKHIYEIRSRYVIACDGARSNVRNHLEIESEGEDSYETMMTIHFSADIRPVVGDRVGMLHWIFDPMAAGFIIAYDLSGNAVLISNFDANQHPVESWSEELCREVLTGAIGMDIKPKILSYRPWLLRRRVAQSYRRGNVFLAGDAAHSFPPTGGLGLNSGLADVHNLAFKLAAVLQGQASTSLLDTYESERRHVADVNSRQSVENGKKIFGLLKTLGTAGLSNLREARANMFEVLHDPSKQQEILDGIEQQREHFDNLNLHIGYVYGDKTFPENASKFQPQFIAGSRLPHTWVRIVNQWSAQQLAPVDVSYVSELSPADATARRFSTLDLCDPRSFTLILPSAEGKFPSQDDAIVRVSKQLGVRINVYRLTDDFVVLPTHSGDSWIRDSGLTRGSGVLVRPDQHILHTPSSGNIAGEVQDALSSFLGQS